MKRMSHWSSPNGNGAKARREDYSLVMRPQAFTPELLEKVRVFRVLAARSSRGSGSVPARPGPLANFLIRGLSLELAMSSLPTRKGSRICIRGPKIAAWMGF
jgi:hypothetical protein